MRWMLQNQREVREAGERLALGTVESYLIYRLTGGLHVTDASNASRTMLMPLDASGWDSELLALFGVPGAAMRSEEHTSELQSLMRISYAVFCLKKKKIQTILRNNSTR